MSLYGMMFGQNPASDVLLAVLGLDKAHVGRFRDAWVEETQNGRVRIGVYTRNGGGNREECSCDSWWSKEDVKWASHHYPAMQHDEERVSTVRSKEIRNGSLITWEQLPESEWYEKREMEPVCDAPDSAGCSCTACIANYVLPNHPQYIAGEDDDFDSTYRTFYFDVPEQFEADLRAVALKEPHDPSKEWAALIDSLKKMNV